MSNFQIGIHLFLQLAVIIALCRMVGFVGRKYLGQTHVFIEMVAGVLLGPSLFGRLSPSAQAWLFPKQLALVTERIEQITTSLFLPTFFTAMEGSRVPGTRQALTPPPAMAS